MAFMSNLYFGQIKCSICTGSQPALYLKHLVWLFLKWNYCDSIARMYPPHILSPYLFHRIAEFRFLVSQIAKAVCLKKYKTARSFKNILNHKKGV